MGTVAENLTAVRARIAAAARAAGRDPAGVELVAVSKTHTADAVRAALAAGQAVFGENRVQEAEHKFPPLRGQFPGLRLHLIGPLQTNKAADAVRLFDLIETVDRPRLAAALAANMDKLGRRLPCFVQVNTGEEPQKAGVPPQQAAQFVDECRSRYRLPIEGLMCIPPVDAPPAAHFAMLRELARQTGVARLSMGMSGDFETAIAEGATSVRVGTAVFGTREAGPR
ncbi:MAG: YggS family pyridoxal phosphate-dependent enzyme [Alphaproteobacteria bacterium]|nr:YggS family pyridoxal phosphate-dependent enzyme [Alphaproteobacteria bacterium]